MGPTPPGTGVMAPATAQASSKATSPTSRPSAPAVDADIDHHRAGGDPLPAHHLGTADRGDQHLGAPAFLGQVAGARMGDGDGAIGAEQQLRHRPADDLRAPQHHRARATQRHAEFRQDVHHPTRRAGHQARLARRRGGPALSGWKPSTSLAGSTAAIAGLGPDMRRQGQLHAGCRPPPGRRSARRCAPAARPRWSRRAGARWRCRSRPPARRGPCCAHRRPRRGPRPRAPRAGRGGRAGRRCAARQAGAQPRGDRLAVEDSRAHDRVRLKSRHRCPAARPGFPPAGCALPAAAG